MREIRCLAIDADHGVRSTPARTGALGIAGTFAVFNSGSVIGGLFEERIAPGAFDEVIKRADVRGLYNHDVNFALGRTAAGTMKLSADRRAAYYEIPELPKARADVLEAVERGDVTGNSFSFTVAPDDEEWIDRGRDKMLPLRIIKRVSQLFDVGPVVFPAYKQTKVYARSPGSNPSLAEPLSGAAERERLRLALAEQ